MLCGAAHDALPLIRWACLLLLETAFCLQHEHHPQTPAAAAPLIHLHTARGRGHHRMLFASRIFLDVPVLRNDAAACVGYRGGVGGVAPRLRPPPSSGRQSSTGPPRLRLDALLLLLLDPWWRQHVENQPATDWTILQGSSMMCWQQLRLLCAFSSPSPSPSLIPLEGMVSV